MSRKLAIAALTTASQADLAICAESGDVYYCPAETGTWTLVSSDRVTDLGARLATDAASDEPNGTADTYSRWCADPSGDDEEIGDAWLTRTRDVAAEATDAGQVALCTLALAGDQSALSRVVRSVARST